MAIEVGVGLWTFQSTAHHPRSLARQYREFPAVARRIEELGYSDVWLGEHRFWYDAWCPAPLMPIAAAAAVTTRLRFGTAMMLLPQHDPVRLADVAGTVRALADGRLEIGVGLGHRDAEFDGVGLRRNQRGKRMETGLDEFGARFDPASVWVGGMAPAALRRLGSRGMSSLMPQTLSEAATRRAVDTITEAADAGVPRGRVGMLKDVWVDLGEYDAGWFRSRLREHYLEEAGAWWVMKGEQHGFAMPEELNAQVERVVDSAVVGSSAEVAAQLAELERLGVDHVVARLCFDFVDPPLLDRALEEFAASVIQAVSA